MAKLNAPLFSFNASGKLARSLVYFAWKGLDVVRSYVVPANPKSAGQTTQRGYFTAAITKIHSIMSGEVDDFPTDKAAYALLASTHAHPRTWFNEIVKLWADCKVASKTPVIYVLDSAIDPDADDFNIQLNINEETGSTLAAGKFYFGTSKTALLYSATATVTAGDNVKLATEDLSDFLTVGEKYYVQFKPDSGDGCEGANSGIYSFIAE